MFALFYDRKGSCNCFIIQNSFNAKDENLKDVTECIIASSLAQIGDHSEVLVEMNGIAAVIVFHNLLKNYLR